MKKGVYKKTVKGKIGIVTYYSFYNYGSALQAYSMSKLLSEKGYEPFLVDYADTSKSWNRRLHRKVKWDRLICLLKHPFFLTNFINSKKVGQYSINSRTESLKNKFDLFIRKEFAISHSDYTKDKSVSAFIAGSDQVWQLSVPGLHPTFFLRFCNKKKRIAYAVSFGTTTIYNFNKRKLKRYISEIPFLAVREDVAVEIVKEVLPKRTDVVQVLDPVLMHNAEWWRKEEIEVSGIKKDYVVCYFLSDPSDYRLHIDSIVAKCQKGTELLWISTGYEKPNENEKVLEPTPREFIALMDNAQYVITDSLHGTEFSILFHKSFTVCERRYLTEAEQNSRILSLLRMFNLHNRLIQNGDKEVLGDIDYLSVETKIEKQRKKSMFFLQNALSSTSSSISQNLKNIN